MRRLAGLIGLLIVFCCGPALADPKFPPLTGRVVDDAHVLTPAVVADLTAKLTALEQQTTRQLVVVTLPSLGGDDIDDYGYRLLRHWGIGQKGTNNGAVFIIVPSEHKVRVEVGYGLEDVLTDALSSVILQRAVLPKFRAGDVQGGIVDGTTALISQLDLPADAAHAQVQAAAAPAPPLRHANPLGAIIPLVVIFFVISSLFRRGGGGGALGFLAPMMILGGMRGGFGGGDEGGGGGWGGGGFGGGGGSGGGGGASGSW